MTHFHLMLWFPPVVELFIFGCWAVQSHLKVNLLSEKEEKVNNRLSLSNRNARVKYGNVCGNFKSKTNGYERWSFKRARQSHKLVNVDCQRISLVRVCSFSTDGRRYWWVYILTISLAVFTCSSVNHELKSAIFSAAAEYKYILSAMT